MAGTSTAQNSTVIDASPEPVVAATISSEDEQGQRRFGHTERLRGRVRRAGERGHEITTVGRGPG